MLRIRIPQNTIRSTVEYSLDVVLNEFLGLKFEFEYYCENFIEIKYDHDLNAKTITIDASFFINSYNSWLNPESLPNIPLEKWDLLDDIPVFNNEKFYKSIVNNEIPVIYGSAGVSRCKNNIHINIDIFGSAFFMLSRYEELVNLERDSHDRFSAFSSIAFKEFFIERPIVDEYVELLWCFINEAWPTLNRKVSASGLYVSCDVDQPFYHDNLNVIRLLKSCVGDIIKRKSFYKMCIRLCTYVLSCFRIDRFDPYYTFDWYMDVCEKANLKATFFFIPSTNEPFNGNYEVRDIKIIKLIKKIILRGHHVGIHSTYQSYNDLEKMLIQKTTFEQDLKASGIDYLIEGNRQHYLRWDSSLTPEYLNAAGFLYDTTGGYADLPGFRFGTSKEFSMWGWLSSKKISLKQRPLIVMECTILSDLYMGLNYNNQTEEYFSRLKLLSLERGGNFSLLWHNSNLSSNLEKLLFEKVVS